MKVINDGLLQRLFQDAMHSERRRAHLLLHNSYRDKVQRLLIGMIQGSYVEPHFHSQPHQWEMFVVMQGEVKVCMYNANGNIISEHLFGPDHTVSIIELSPGDIHSVECLSDKALLLEVKEGPFDPSHAKTLV